MNVEKQNMAIRLKEELKMHFEKNEKDAKQ